MTYVILTTTVITKRDHNITNRWGPRVKIIVTYALRVYTRFLFRVLMSS